MPNSMTGFATAEVQSAALSLRWEVRSVNHRFLDLSFRVPDELRSLEPELRDIAAGVVSRGKVDCTLKVSQAAGATAKTEIDTTVAADLVGMQKRLMAQFADAAPLSIAELLRWPGLLRSPEPDLAALGEPARDSFRDAVQALGRARSREGERIAEHLQQRGAAIVDLLAGLRPLVAGAAERHRHRLAERVARLDVRAEPERLEQELALLAQRVDVMEEMDRIESHMVEISNTLGRAEPMGRRLDFLLQELNREANTLGSKVQEEELTRQAVELKVLIEQMREQVQNLE